MAEPTTTTTAAGWALAAGTLGAFFASIGVSWPLVFWGLVGGLFGLSFAPPAGRLRSMAMFPGSALLAAKGGAVVGAQYFAGNPDMAGALAAVGGIIAHPLIAASVKALPAAVGRITGKTAEETPQ